MITKLYENIRKRRRELGMTQSQLAEKMNYADKSMIAKIEKGIVDLPQSKIASFARVLDTTPATLMGWTDSESMKAQQGVMVPLCVGFENGSPVLSRDSYELSVNVTPRPVADFFLQITDAVCNPMTVYVSRQDQLEDGVPYVFFYKGKFLVRSSFRYANGSLILLRSSDAKEKDIEVTSAVRKQLHIVGKVIGIKTRLQ